MVGQSDTRSRIQSLIAARDAVEAQVAQHTAGLQQMGIGMQDALVDKEGYPRADIDVAAARTHRNRIAMLTNDHKALTKQIEQLLHELHSGASTNGGKQSPVPSSSAPLGVSSPAAPAPPQPLAHAHDPGAGLRAFASIDEVSVASPAADAGLQVGDVLLAMGSVSASEGGMAALPALLQGWHDRGIAADTKTVAWEGVVGVPSGAGVTEVVTEPKTEDRGKNTRP